MTSLMVERIGVPSGTRDIRALELTHRRALDGHDDVVVLHDALTAMLAQAIRERGAHVVWQVHAAGAPAREAAWTFLRRYTPGVDAYVVTWLEPPRRGVPAESIAAVMPSADVVAAKEVTAGGGSHRRHDLAWSSVLADVVDADRGESVDGTLHRRPVVAAL